MTAKHRKPTTPLPPVNGAPRGAPRRPKRPAAQSVSWDAPWKSADDATGWTATYRGTGRAHEVTSSLVLELTPEQNEWIDRVAEATGITPHAVLKRLIDEARAAAG